MKLSDKEWKERLSPEQYKILRKKKTERAFTGDYHDCKKKGVYHCAGCGEKLFRSEDKFDSGTGWPSFVRPIDESTITYEKDNTLFTKRIEVLCSNCMGHLGHVFDDGPPPTNKRYCLNSLALKLKETA
ncbi:MAG: Peptide methionine sulfoxide reductase MsrB [Chlamydiae bacterium]|nr:Peptide methionine sulfoxide reductase MsrB [Chlamydiota bacterium]